MKTKKDYNMKIQRQIFIDAVLHLKLNIKVSELLLELQALGYFKAPSSTKYHGAFEGGLLAHSIEVMTQLCRLSSGLDLTWERPESPIIIGLFHDLCKSDLYEWDAENERYVYSDDSWLPGHGERSIIMLQKLIDLTDEEVACIRWHMGSYETDTKMWAYYDKAIKKYPNVLYTHMADMMASKIVGI